MTRKIQEKKTLFKGSEIKKIRPEEKNNWEFFTMREDDGKLGTIMTLFFMSTEIKLI